MIPVLLALIERLARSHQVVVVSLDPKAEPSEYELLGARVVRVAVEGNRIKLVVDDSGPGIPADQRGQIFDRFRRATDQPGGAGLGLAIADAVVRATNGRWEVGASAAGGASMAVSWPRLLARPSATRAASSETPPPLARLDA